MSGCNCVSNLMYAVQYTSRHLSVAWGVSIPETTVRLAEGMKVRHAFGSAPGSVLLGPRNCKRAAAADVSQRQAPSQPAPKRTKERARGGALAITALPTMVFTPGGGKSRRVKLIC